MAFKMELDTSGDNCDKCKKPMNPEAPGMWLREMDNVILLHIDCMQKLIRKAEKEAIQP